MSKTVFFITFLFAFFCACQQDSDTPQLPETSQLNDFIHSGSLLTEVVNDEDKWILKFETGTLSFDKQTIRHIEQSGWNSTVLFSDNSSIEIPTLGKDIELNKRKLSINPKGYTPLSAEMEYSAPVRSRVKIVIAPKDKSKSTAISHVFEKYGYNHVIPIHGLYAGHKNKVIIVLTDKEGRERQKDSLEIDIPPLKNITLPAIQAIKAIPEKMEQGLTLINYLGENEFDTHRPFMIDSDGEIRWFLNLKGHPEIGNITAHVGLQRMKNGNFLCGDVKTSRIIEIDMFGNVIKKWELNSLGYEFHHEVTEMPNGNLLACVTKKDSKAQSGESSIFDYVVEIDHATGALKTVWDLKQSFNEKRKAQDAAPIASNWAHNNAVAYSEADDAIIISMRYQGIAKVNRENQVKWILSPHKDWGNNGRGENLSAYLLQPLDHSGNKINDNKVLDGSSSHPEFDWSWGPHCPVLLPDGTLFVFDNGYFRNYVETDLYSQEGYSRAVAYKIDERLNTVQETWQYGKERGRSCYAVAVSSVQFLPNKKHVLFCPGVGTPNINGVGGKVIEVDMETGEVVYEAHLSTPAFLVFHRATRMDIYTANE